MEETTVCTSPKYTEESGISAAFEVRDPSVNECPLESMEIDDHRSTTNISFDSNSTSSIELVNEAIKSSFCESKPANGCSDQDCVVKGISPQFEVCSTSRPQFSESVASETKCIDGKTDVVSDEDSGNMNVNSVSVPCSKEVVGSRKRCSLNDVVNCLRKKDCVNGDREFSHDYGEYSNNHGLNVNNNDMQEFDVSEKQMPDSDKCASGKRPLAEDEISFGKSGCVGEFHGSNDDENESILSEECQENDVDSVNSCGNIGQLDVQSTSTVLDKQSLNLYGNHSPQDSCFVSKDVSDSLDVINDSAKNANRGEKYRVENHCADLNESAGPNGDVVSSVKRGESTDYQTSDRGEHLIFERAIDKESAIKFPKVVKRDMVTKQPEYPDKNTIVKWNKMIVDDMYRGSGDACSGLITAAGSGLGGSDSNKLTSKTITHENDPVTQVYAKGTLQGECEIDGKFATDFCPKQLLVKPSVETTGFAIHGGRLVKKQISNPRTDIADAKAHRRVQDVYNDAVALQRNYMSHVARSSDTSNFVPASGFDLNASRNMELALGKISMTTKRCNFEYCLFCSFATAVPFELEKHMRTHIQYSDSPAKLPPLDRRPSTQNHNVACKNVVESANYIQRNVRNCQESFSALHSRKPSLKCSQCPAVFVDESDLLVHEECHKDSQRFRIDLFKCNDCPALFLNKTELDQHLRMHLMLLEFRFPCGQCPAFFKQKAELDLHVHLHGNYRRAMNFGHAANESASSISKANVEEALDSPQQGATMPSPTSVKAMFSDFNWYGDRQNISNHQNDQLSPAALNLQVSSKSSMGVDSSIDNELQVRNRLPERRTLRRPKFTKLIRCKYCNKMFRSKLSRTAHALKHHANVHDVEKHGVLNLEGSNEIPEARNDIRVSLQSESMQEFTKESDTEQTPAIPDLDTANTTPLPCSFCSRSFLCNRNLHIHMSRMHSMDILSPIVTFSNDKSGVPHSSMALNSEPAHTNVIDTTVTPAMSISAASTFHGFECTFCLRKFSSNKSLVSHIRKYHSRVHKSASVNQLDVENQHGTGYSTLSSDNTTSLAYNSSPSKSNDDKALGQASTLSNMKPVSCSICYRMFSSVGYMKSHMTKTHLSDDKANQDISNSTKIIPSSAVSHNRLTDTYNVQNEYKSTVTDSGINSSDPKLPLLYAKCILCPRQFSRKKGLISHFSKVHGAVLPKNDSYMMPSSDTENLASDSAGIPVEEYQESWSHSDMSFPPTVPETDKYETEYDSSNIPFETSAVPCKSYNDNTLVKCQLCSRSFYGNRAIVVHLRRAHASFLLKVRKYFYLTSGKRFNKKSKAYVCKLCNSNFGQLSDITTHCLNSHYSKVVKSKSSKKLNNVKPHSSKVYESETAYWKTADTVACLETYADGLSTVDNENALTSAENDDVLRAVKGDNMWLHAGGDNVLRIGEGERIMIDDEEIEIPGGLKTVEGKRSWKASANRTLLNCRYCRKVFKYRTYLNKHVSKKHIGATVELNPVDDSLFNVPQNSHSDGSNVETTAGLFKCQWCPKTCVCMRFLRIHIAKKHKHKSQWPSQSQLVSDL